MADKEDFVLRFTDGRTVHIEEMDALEFVNMLGAMESMVQDKGSIDERMDKARKRLMGAIGGYLRAMHKKDDARIIKGVALHACGGEYKQFNAIPYDRLRSLYNAFRNRTRDLETVAGMVSSTSLTNPNYGKVIRDYKGDILPVFMDLEKLPGYAEQERERLGCLMQEAVDGEEYELAEEYNRKIEKLKAP
jgi:hypothetical protein